MEFSALRRDSSIGLRVREASITDDTRSGGDTVQLQRSSKN
jgi:hypothetical protein